MGDINLTFVGAQIDFWTNLADLAERAYNIVCLSQDIVSHFDITVVLWFGCFVAWVRFLTHFEIFPWTWTHCKLGAFMFRFGRHYSSMLLVLMSLEKCFAVYFPLKSKTVCTVKTSKWATGIVGVILAGYDSMYIVAFNTIIKPSGNKDCVLNGKYMIVLWSVDSVLYSFGPLALMFITNIAIVFKFMTAKCKSNNETESTDQALAKSATSGTAMVVIVSVTFLVLNTPEGLRNAVPSLALEEIPWYRVFMNFTSYLNHSINGVLYCIVGTRFRTELSKIFCRQNSVNSVTKNSCH